MAGAIDDGGFWLPSEFLTDDDILMGEESCNKNGIDYGTGANFCFPTEFPYDFGSSSVLNSPVESVGGSTETESDEEDLVAGLSRLLARSTLQETQKIITNPQNIEKSWILSGSPQSTLSVVGSWSGQSAVSSNGSPNGPSQVSSPPTTPLSPNNDAWDLIYAAAGEISRLKKYGEGPPNGRLLDPPRSITPVHTSQPVKSRNNEFYSNQCLSHNHSQTCHFQHVRRDQIQKPPYSSSWGRPAKECLCPQHGQFQQSQMPRNRVGRVGAVGFVESGRCGRPLGLPQSAWPPLQVRHQHHQNHHQQQCGAATGAVFRGGSGVKRECAGTGVFLPRRYGNPSDSRKKPAGVHSAAMLQARVVQSLNKNFDDMTLHTHAQHRFSGTPFPDYGALMARRNALLAEQRRSLRPEESCANNEIRLPKEWTY